jgi:hypothetical protein
MVTGNATLTIVRSKYQTHSARKVQRLWREKWHHELDKTETRLRVRLKNGTGGRQYELGSLAG